MITGNQGVIIIKSFETLHDGNLKKIGLQPKLCPSNIVTLGYGHALKDLNGQWLKGVDGLRRMMEIYPDWETITVEEAEKLLMEDLIEREDMINSLKLKLTQYQFDAIVSLVFNIGFGNFKTSTLLRRIRGEKGSIRDAFAMWNRSDGKVWPGLIRRRACESLLFETGELNLYPI